MVPLLVSPVTWAVTIVLIVALLAFDYVFHVRKAHVPTLKEAAIWSAIYIGIAIVFGLVVWLITPGHEAGIEYFAGYVTEKALSIDNLFVFLVIISSFKVPRADQQKVLLFGIMFALVSRTVLIAAGAAMIERWSWVFYLFGLFLLVTAGHLLFDHGDDEGGDNAFIRFMKTHLRTSDYYDSDKLFTRIDGRRVLTPMLLVMIAIGGTDVLFAFDSIPAIYGLTQEPYIVFTATAFSLMGLRQLYFLIDGLLDRLVYLSYGLAVVLGFIGVKLVLHALHENRLPFINRGDPVEVFELSTGTSLLVIVGVLVVTVLLSLFTPSGRARTAIHNATRHVDHYLDLSWDTYPDQRSEAYAKLVESEQTLIGFDQRHRRLIVDDHDLLRKLAEAHTDRATYLAAHPECTATFDAAPRLDPADYPAEASLRPGPAGTHD